MDFSLFNGTVPTTSAVVTGSMENGTGVIDITIAYQGELVKDDNDSNDDDDNSAGLSAGADYVVSGAVIKASIELGGPTRT